LFPGNINVPEDNTHHDARAAESDVIGANASQPMVVDDQDDSMVADDDTDTASAHS
jgi:hypothetical protein